MDDVERMNKPFSPAVRQALVDALKAGEAYLAETKPERLHGFRLKTWQCPVCGNHGRTPDTVDCAAFCRRMVVGCAVQALRSLRVA